MDKKFLTSALGFFELANARTASPPQASAGRITLSTSPVIMQPLPGGPFAVETYWGAALNPASTHGRKV